jgi:adenosylcobinamide kinase / adenosylcobinamide-phosphate guanylyltransferase
MGMRRRGRAIAQRPELRQNFKTQMTHASVLVIGAARSGKSSFARTLAENSGKIPLLIATAEARDAEMAARIAMHRAERGAAWQVVEEPHALLSVLRREAQAKKVILVDCLTLWLSNRLLAGGAVEAEGDALAQALCDLAGPVIFVSNEVGAGIVPETEIGRCFRDAQGRLNQKLAAACTRVFLVAAGLPLVLKPASEPSLLL